jgi:hypothetical protein
LCLTAIDKNRTCEKINEAKNIQWRTYLAHERRI